MVNNDINYNINYNINACVRDGEDDDDGGGDDDDDYDQVTHLFDNNNSAWQSFYRNSVMLV